MRRHFTPKENGWGCFWIVLVAVVLVASLLWLVLWGGAIPKGAEHAKPPAAERP